MRPKFQFYTPMINNNNNKKQTKHFLTHYLAVLTLNFDSILENSAPEKFATFEELNEMEQARLSLK